ncbi:ADP-ribosylglycohydrolase family protein [Halomonas salipaludis]|uniref:ADP-ribosylglycohydrolase n=1 Tax=Halomonas salipaludis TaxID=2032625 RepID=A0A2A2ES38_9GAMM|nr:ADP-ribosylglycohydrolase family protein [Halomonas salipaludis]PAU75172.1 ADP-ribosylglycohydrolase [Halomonas salipaludis]
MPRPNVSSRLTFSGTDNGLRERALGAFHGLALGDALGMPTQSLSRAEIIGGFGTIAALVDAHSDQPIAPNMPAGSITDDTEQAILVADLLIEGRGRIAPIALANRLIAWEDRMRERGSLDLLGPSTKRAIELIVAGTSPHEAGRFGATNGAAMRITPVGIAFDIDDEERLLEAVCEASCVTHNTNLGIASAAAVAAAISAGLNGASPREALDAGVRLAERAEAYGFWIAGALIAPRITWARKLVRNCDDREVIEQIHDLVGTSVAAQESVVAAFALAEWAEQANERPQRVLCLAASLGGDTDTIAAMLGAMLGACHGLNALPARWVKQVCDVNGLALEPLVDQLLVLRAGE